LGVPFAGQPGPNNAITDVEGVSVGYATLIEGEGPLQVGKGPVRTGVTGILPRPLNALHIPVFSGYHSFNGNGELTGSHYIAEAGIACGPVTLTNTHACGITRDASIDWVNKHRPEMLGDSWSLPVAGETYDGYLNDINGGHVRAEHVHQALDSAFDGAIEEGSVGGGTGMINFGYKAGSGTASREVVHGDEQFTVGAFVQSNFGSQHQLTVRGHRLGEQLVVDAQDLGPEKSSIIVVLATDAPLLPHQLNRLARRATVGVALTGGIGHHGSGDIFLAFSTANPQALTAAPEGFASLRFIPDVAINPFFEAVVHSVEEAILNALIANQPMRGRDDRLVPALQHDAVRRLFGTTATTVLQDVRC
jgi:D-aminopeptidase